MEKAELVFIPLPVVGHLTSTVELAKLILHHDPRLSTTLLILKPSKFNLDIISFPSSSISERIRFINLPEIQPLENKDPVEGLTNLVNSQIPHVKQFVDDFFHSNSAPESPRIAAFVVDMFCSAMKDIADEHGFPTYMYFSCSAAYLGFQLHLQNLVDKHNFDPSEFKNSDNELNLPSCINPVPFKVLPDSLLKEEYIEFSLSIPRGARRVKGILVNSFVELESRAIHSLQYDTEAPTLYPVGPILNFGTQLQESSASEHIMKWLDDQPPASVVFLCFGSMGTIVGEQVTELASGLENSGVRFLWSLRVPQVHASGRKGAPIEITNFEEILPAGFLDRTAKVGRVIGWAPQVKVLAHRAVGGFVSHCGWNSTLESLYFGVPMATLPLYAEQQFNAFLLVREIGVGVEIKMDYRRGFAVETEEIVSAEVIEKAIELVRESGGEVRKKVKEMSLKGKEALMADGSSYCFLRQFIDDIFRSMPPMK